MAHQSFSRVTITFVLLLVGCTPRTPTAEAPPAMKSPTLIQAPTDMPTTRPRTQDLTPTCGTHSVSMSLDALSTSLRVGETVTVSVTLVNQGCAMVGLPVYRLSVWSDGPEPVLEPQEPEEVKHFLGLYEGGSDTAEFTLHGVRAGSATLMARASYEVHLGYPGPAYWSSSCTRQLVITVVGD